MSPAENVVQIHSQEDQTEVAAEMIADEFVSVEDLAPVHRDNAKRSQRRMQAEISELARRNRWEDVLALCYPVDEKCPDLVAHQLDAPIRSEAAFALGHVNRFDDAIAELRICIQADSQNFRYHSSLAYTAYNSLFAAKNREVFLSGKHRAQRVDLAHRHFRQAQLLRPDGVTNFYRQGMLYKQLEDKPDKALPLFKQAISHWDKLDENERQDRHYERKNYIKSLYQLASTALIKGHAKAALTLILRCIQEDEATAFMGTVFKYFALGKVQFHLGQYNDAADALRFAAQQCGKQPKDFVCELLARTCLALNAPARALEAIEQVPEKARRPYFRWTEADVYCALKKYDLARDVLVQTAEKDNRGRHKALNRLARLEYLQGRFEDAAKFAQKADGFFRNHWQKPCAEALFMQAVSAYRMKDMAEARVKADELFELDPGYRQLDKLRQRLRAVSATEESSHA